MNMNRLKIKYIFSVALVSGLLTACVDDLSVTDELYYGSSDYISFSVDMNDIEATTTTRSEHGDLHMVAEEWPLVVSKAVTRATPYSSFPTDAGLIGYNFDTWDGSTITPWEEMYNALYHFNDNKLQAESHVPWLKANNGSKLRVYAYAPKGFVHDAVATLSGSNVAGVPTITYTVPTNVGEQIDLLAAVSADKTVSEKTAVPLTFDHALSAIRFNVGFDCIVQSVSIQGVYDRGTYTIGGSWESLSKSVETPTFTVSLGYNESTGVYDGESFTAGSSITTPDNTFMLIPQTIPDGAKVVLKYKLSAGDAEWSTIERTIVGKPTAWEKGKRYTYTMYKDATIDYIYFDLAAGDIYIGNTGDGAFTYSGKVYHLNAAGTGYEALTIKGNHVDGNKYYVYQSSTITGSPGYYTGTGFSSHITGTDETTYWNDPSHWSGFRTPPSYTEVKKGDQTWSEYITNNKDCDAVINNWPSSATDVGREVTHNRIHISSNKTNGTEASRVLAVDIVIDNIWSDNHSDNSAERWTGGFMIHPQNNVPNSGSYYKDRISYEHVTLRLKGDNRFTNIMYFGHGPNAVYENNENASWFKVTSVEGDGSPVGSLTVNPATSTDVVREGSSVFGCKNDNYGPPALGLKLFGGTIYVSTNSNQDDNNIGVLGGGANNGCEITFDGAVVTSVAYSSAAAIGGGSGRLLWGGDGEITIRSGKVYAYQYGIYRTSALSSSYYEGSRSLPANTALPTVAIGGGSSFTDKGNDAIVRISGGEVYAQSLGGVAIGGGTSAFANGGNADITISGGYVEAKSISGARTGSISLSASSSIGGGRGGISYSLPHSTWPRLSDDDYNVGFGGNAKFNISGGVIKTGSLGGGSIITAREDITIGSADITVSGGTIQGQFIMAAGNETPPSFNMTGGTINNAGLSNTPADDGFHKMQSNGGAVYIGGGTNPGTFTMNGTSAIIQNSSATKGGAVYQEGGRFFMKNGTIQNCTATEGGGAVYLDISTPQALGGQDMEMTGGTIQKNTSSTHGGGIYIDGGSLSIANTDATSLIRDNKASHKGGGVYVEGGAFLMSAGSITNNAATHEGGGVSVASATAVTVTGGNITGNSSGEYGGGISVEPTTTLTVTLGEAGRTGAAINNPEISNNMATKGGGGVYVFSDDADVDANLTIESGKIKGNKVSALEANKDIRNEGGLVTFNDGDVEYVTVTYHMNDGSNPETFATQKIVTSVSSKLVEPSPTWTWGAKTLSKWNTQEDGSGTDYAKDQEVILSSNIDLYAVWVTVTP